jgi:putative flippase GtrA
MKIFNDTLLRFILVGCVNALFGASIIFILYNFAGCGYWVSSAANYFFGSILSFFLNKYFTFRIKHWSVHMIIAFILTIAVSYLLAYSIAKPVVSYMLRDYSPKIRGNCSLFAGMCLFTLLNYIGQSVVVFRRKSE